MRLYRRLLGRVLFRTATASLLMTTASAQSNPPPQNGINPLGETVDAASVFEDGHQLYVIGGRSGGGNECLSDVLVLDLANPWTIDRPSYRMLPEGQPSCFPTAVWSRGGSKADTTNNSNNGRQEIIVFNRENITRFDLASQTWKVQAGSLVMGTIPYPGIGRRASIDPTTDKVYLPGASLGTGGLLQYDPLTGFTTDLPQPNATLDISSYSFVYSELRRSFILFGGDLRDQGGLNGVTYEFSPDINSWSILSTMGDIPPTRKSHCMVPAHGGRMMVLYGGYGSGKLSDIYMLDVQQLSWKRGTPGGAANERSNHVCAVSGDMFIAWGGQAAKNIVGVYNLKTNEWQPNFSPPPAAPKDTPSGSSKSALAIGLAVGLTVLVVLIVGIYFYIRRRRSQQRPDSPNEESRDDRGDEKCGRPKPHDDPASTNGALAEETLGKEEHLRSAALTSQSLGRNPSTVIGDESTTMISESSGTLLSSKARASPRSPHTTLGEGSRPVVLPGPQALRENKDKD
ncbi:Host cell factor 2 [Actinomortierella wolfii]|nr:Host cell factor 2 [Actinomortierella wolfii]